MPMYACQCGRCGHRHDAFARIAERTRIKCPKCGCRRQRRLPVAGAVRRPWDGKDARSWMFNVDPEAAKAGAFAQDLPSWKFGPDGHAHFDGDVHQKKCFAEFKAAKERLEAEDEAQEAKETAHAG